MKLNERAMLRRATRAIERLILEADVDQGLTGLTIHAGGEMITLPLNQKIVPHYLKVFNLLQKGGYIPMIYRDGIDDLRLICVEDEVAEVLGQHFEQGVDDDTFDDLVEYMEDNYGIQAANITPDRFTPMSEDEVKELARTLKPLVKR